MTEFADLSPYTYLRSGRAMVNVGWLGTEFPTGPVGEDVLDRLSRLAREPEHLTRGRHGCDICKGAVAGLGNGEIHVRGADGVTYAAPTLIVHYIEAHGYRPPDVFLAAVRHAISPPPDAMCGPARLRGAHYPGAVTDVYETTEQPDLIATHYLTSIEDVTEHLRAANRLGLGVRVRSYLEADDEDEALVEHWEVELFTSSPVHEGDVSEPEPAEPGE